MKIALMTNNYKPIVGGVPISIERLARGLRALGHEVTIFAPTYREQRSMEKERTEESGEGKSSTGKSGAKKSGAGERGAEDGADRENVFRYATCMNHFIGGIVLPNPFDRRIEREFRRNTYDIIHVHHPMLIGRTAVRLSRRYHIPLAFTYHTRYEQYASCYTGGICRLDWFMPLYLHMFMRHCDFVFAPTAGMREYLTGKCRVKTGKTGILPTGIEKGSYEVPVSQADAVRARYGAEHMPMLLTVSRMAQEKNVSFLLKGLARVKELYGKPFRMLMVGDGPDREALQDYSAELGLRETIVFTGAVPNEEIAPYYRAADAFLFASRTETQGIVVLEAFAGATPVIAVRASGVEDLVDDGVNGFLTGEDAEEYALKVTEYLNALGSGVAEESGEKCCEMSLPSPRTAEGSVLPGQLSANAFQKGVLYREEAVAMKAVHYYNDVIVHNAAQKKRKTRLQFEG